MNFAHQRIFDGIYPLIDKWVTRRHNSCNTNSKESRFLCDVFPFLPLNLLVLSLEEKLLQNEQEKANYHLFNIPSPLLEELQK